MFPYNRKTLRLSRQGFSDNQGDEPLYEQSPKQWCNFQNQALALSRNLLQDYIINTIGMSILLDFFIHTIFNTHIICL